MAKTFCISMPRTFLRPHHAAVEQRQPRCHEQHQGRGHQHPGCVPGIDLHISSLSVGKTHVRLEPRCFVRVSSPARRRQGPLKPERHLSFFFAASGAGRSPPRPVSLAAPRAASPDPARCAAAGQRWRRPWPSGGAQPRTAVASELPPPAMTASASSAGRTTSPRRDSSSATRGTRAGGMATHCCPTRSTLPSSTGSRARRDARTCTVSRRASTSAVDEPSRYQSSSSSHSSGGERSRLDPQQPRHALVGQLAALLLVLRPSEDVHLDRLGLPRFLERFSHVVLPPVASGNGHRGRAVRSNLTAPLHQRSSRRSRDRLAPQATTGGPRRSRGPARQCSRSDDVWAGALFLTNHSRAPSTERDQHDARPAQGIERPPPIAPITLVPSRHWALGLGGCRRDGGLGAAEVVVTG